MTIKFNYKISIDKKTVLNRIGLTLFIIACARLGTYIPIPWIDQEFLYEELKNSQFVNFFSSFSQGDYFIVSILTLGILPNINASIIIQLLRSVFPYLQRLQKKEGEFGRRKILQITRYLTVLLSLLYGFSIAFYIKPFVFGWSLLKAAEISILLTIGAVIMLWFSEIIDKYGLGNGSSLFIIVNISSSLPAISRNFNSLDNKLLQFFLIISFIIGICSVVLIQSAVRQLLVVSIKTLKLWVDVPIMMSSFLSLRVNVGGVMPLIFTATLVNGISILFGIMNININQYTYLLIYFVLTLLFSYLYSTVVVDPNDVADDLDSWSFNLPDVSPGLETILYLGKLLNRLALLGGLFLALGVTLPTLFASLNPNLSSFQGARITALFILVGVTLDLIRKIRTFKIVESYDKIEM